MPSHHRLLRAVSAGAVVCLSASVASATITEFTQIQGGGQGGSEPSVWQVLNTLVGGGASLTQADVNDGGVDIGGVTGLSRLDDDVDQLYTGDITTVSVAGLFFNNADINNPFGGDDHNLFFEDETSGDPAVQVTQNENVLAPISVGEGGVFSLTAVRGVAFDGSQNNSSRAIASSIDSENIADGDTTTDRMVTFVIDVNEIPSINTLDGESVNVAAIAEDENVDVAYVHFFDTGSDADYQDAVYVTIGAQNIPAPGAAFLLSVAGLAATRRRR